MARLLVVAGVFAVAACGKDDAGSRKGPGPVPVTVEKVVQEDVPLEIAAFGTVEASSTVDVVPQVTGLVTEVHFKEGDFVEKGQLLFSVDTRTYRASLAAAQADLERNQALAAQAKVEADRAAKLAGEGITSAQEAARAQADAESTAANVKVGRAALANAGLNVAFTRVTSPIAGRTGTLLVHAGNVVHVGDTQPLVVVRSLSPVQVRFAVPEEYLGRIRDRLQANELTVRVRPKGQSGPEIEGPVSFLENSVDTTTGTLSLKATFPNQKLELWPGEAVDVVLVLDIDRRAIVAPESAVQAGQDGKHAFVVEQGKAKLRPVDVSRTTATLALIRSGLRVGEDVVTDGQVRLRDGTPVTVKPAAPKPDSGPEARR